MRVSCIYCSRWMPAEIGISSTREDCNTGQIPWNAIIDLTRYGVIVTYITSRTFPMRTPLLFSAAFSAIAMVALSACSTGSASNSSAAKPEPAGVAVETARAEHGELIARYTATANLQAEHEARLVSEVPGTVLNILVEEGDLVRKGQVLARIDADRSRLQLREAEADLQRRRNDVERGGKLLARQLIAATTHDQAESDYAVRRAEVDLARVAVGKSEIRAPFDGVVTRRLIKQGQLLAAQAPAFEIADFSDLRAELRVPERDAVSLAANQAVTFSVDAVANREFSAKIERIAPIVDRASGTINVVVRVENRERLLRPGLFARMSIDVLHLDNALLVPKTAVLGNRNSAISYVVENGKVRRAALRLGNENGSRVQVLEGLEPGAEVVVTGHAALSEGASVDVLPATTAIAQTKPVSAVRAKRS